jgi:hypothetical protein
VREGQQPADDDGQGDLQGTTGGRGDRLLQPERGRPVVGADGTYTLETGNLGEGAAPGEYVVLVRWPVETSKDPNRPAGKDASTAPDRLKRKYFNPAKPLLAATVTEGANVIPTFELTD